MSDHYHHYAKKLQPLARNLRNNSAKSEIRLWRLVLSNKQMLGFSFLRQRPIDKYIADFFCKQLRLVIELDGLTHQWEETVEKDERKQKKLESLGYAVLRFNDEEVMNRIEQVSMGIEMWIREHHGDKIAEIYR